VLAVWDQDGAGSAPLGFAYGHACDRERIVLGRCDLDDPIGHGTHVAGIAAGAHVLPGIAPEASIVMVRSRNFTRLADAVRFIFNTADVYDRPAVVNLSVGGHYGPHDGRTALEDYLENALGPGRLMVAAAGNDTNRAKFAAGPNRIDAE